MKRLLSAVLCAALLAGCAAPITYYSRGEDPAKPGTLRFHIPPGAYSTVVLYPDAYDCRGIQRVAFFKNGVNDVVHVPRDKVITFSVYLQLPGGVGSFQYANRGYTVPFTTGELRVDTDFDSKGFLTRTYSREADGQWRLVTDVVERQMSQPFLESGAWCKADERFSH